MAPAPIVINTSRESVVSHQKFIYSINLNISTPEILFVAQDIPICQISIPITGGIYQISSAGALIESGAIPGNYTIIASIPVNNITFDSNFTSKNALSLTRQTDKYSYLHFNTATFKSNTFQISPALSENDSDNACFALQAAIDYLSTSLTEIQLGWQSETTSAQNFGISLRSGVVAGFASQVSFFTSAYDQTKAPGSMNPDPTLHTADGVVSLIPQDTNGSLILGGQYFFLATTHDLKPDMEPIQIPEVIEQAMGILFYNNQTFNCTQNSQMNSQDLFAAGNITES